MFILASATVILSCILGILLILGLLAEYLPSSVRVAIAKYLQTKKLFRHAIPWFWIGMVVLFFFSAALRFWGLSRFNTTILDEVFFAQFANDYLNQIPFADGHPPLGKYMIAIGIWIDTHNPFKHDALKNTHDVFQLDGFSYRWMNALIGSLIPLVVAGIAYQLSRRRSYAFIAGLFAATDGLFLVESRGGLINVYLVIFGLLGQWFLLLALDKQPRGRGFWLALSGICFGACFSVKWNGLGFLLGIYLIWMCAWAIRWVQKARSKQSKTDNPPLGLTNSNLFQTPLQNLTRLRYMDLLFDLGIVPGVIYYLVWIPHEKLYPGTGFLQLQQQLLAWHEGVGSDSHPYCSPWYTWPWMIRPVGYFFQQKVIHTLASVSSLLASQPKSEEVVYYDVHGMGNPVLWWLSTAATILVMWALVQKIRAWAISPQTTESHQLSLFQSSNFLIPLYLISNYAANLLPWMKVTRCAFLYHYMEASVFALLALAWIVDRWLQSYHLWFRAAGFTIIFLILLAFVFWLPIYLGLPLSPEEFRMRMWLPSWI